MDSQVSENVYQHQAWGTSSRLVPTAWNKEALLLKIMIELHHDYFCSPKNYQVQSKLRLFMVLRRKNNFCGLRDVLLTDKTDFIVFKRNTVAGKLRDSHILSSGEDTKRLRGNLGMNLVERKNLLLQNIVLNVRDWIMIQVRKP